MSLGLLVTQSVSVTNTNRSSISILQNYTNRKPYIWAIFASLFSIVILKNLLSLEQLYRIRQHFVTVQKPTPAVQ